MRYEGKAQRKETWEKGHGESETRWEGYKGTNILWRHLVNRRRGLRRRRNYLTRCLFLVSKIMEEENMESLGKKSSLSSLLCTLHMKQFFFRKQCEQYNKKRGRE